MGLQGVDCSDVRQQVLERVFVELLPPHKFDEIGIQLGSAGSTFPPVPLLCPTPHGFYVVRSSVGDRVYEVGAVVDCEVLVPESVDGVVGCPQVRDHRSSWQNELLQDRQQGGSIACGNCHKETLLGLHVDSAQHPLGVHPPSNIGLPTDKCGFVNLHHMARTTDGQGVKEEVFRKNVSRVIPPVRDGLCCHPAFSCKVVDGCGFIGVVVQEVQNLHQLQFGISSKEAPIPDGDVLLAASVLAPPPTPVAPLIVSDLGGGTSTGSAVLGSGQKSMTP